jgi:hypothetical protein
MFVRHIGSEAIESINKRRRDSDATDFKDHARDSDSVKGIAFWHLDAGGEGLRRCPRRRRVNGRVNVLRLGRGFLDSKVRYSVQFVGLQFFLVLGQVLCADVYLRELSW